MPGPVRGGQVSQRLTADPVARRLATTPGVGPVTAVAFVATLDDVTRFARPGQVAAYLGLVPRAHSSGERQRRGALTKAGNTRLRWLLVQAAWGIWRDRHAASADRADNAGISTSPLPAIRPAPLPAHRPSATGLPTALPQRDMEDDAQFVALDVHAYEVLESGPYSLESQQERLMAPMLRLWRTSDPFLPNVFSSFFNDVTCGGVLGMKNTKPTVNFLTPGDGDSRPYGVPVAFSATVTDPEGGPLTLEWLDEAGNAIGTGSPMTQVFPAPATRKIRAIAHDSRGTPSQAVEHTIFLTNSSPEPHHREAQRG